ncbi:MAG: hypothetical protein FWF37_01945 [Chloroflexi bacterium]|nr:hypothetical protein [Chloroflexota bacterium]
MVKIIKKVGMTLASVLILASMFSGVALAKSNTEEYQNQQLYASVALTLSQSNDFTATFKSMTQETQDKIAARLHYLNKQMEMVDDINAYFNSLTPAEQLLIYFDSTNLGVRIEYSSVGHEHESALISSSGTVENEDPYMATVSGSCPSQCSFYCDASAFYYGTISNDTHFIIYACAYFLHGDGNIVFDAYSTYTFMGTYNGWTKVSLDSTPTYSNLKYHPYYTGPYTLNDAVSTGFMGSAKHTTLFVTTTEYGGIVLGTGFDKTTGDHLGSYEVSAVPMSNSNNASTVASIVLAILAIVVAIL